MKKIGIAISLLLLLSLIPTAALAQVPAYYCSYNVGTGGDGSYSYPWQCTDSNQVNQLVSQICSSHTSAVLYQIVSNGYYYHTIGIPSGGTCQITSSVFYSGYPPNTGITLPVPLMISAMVALGIALLGGGYLIYRKRNA
jgi:hypothetical protein